MLLNVFINFIKLLFEHGHIMNRHKNEATFDVWRDGCNKIAGVPNVPVTKLAKRLGIPVRKATDKMLGLSDTRALKTAAQYTY